VTADRATWGRLAFGVFYMTVLAIGLALGVRVMIDGYSAVPFADFWDQFPFIELGLRGNLGIDDLWAQSNEHRILVARVQFLLDYRLFDGTNVLLFAAIAASSLLLATCFAGAVWLDTRDWLMTLGTLAVAGTATMSPAGIENLTWAFQVQFVQVFLFATLSVLAIVVAGRSTTPSQQLLASAGAALAAIAATYSMANGLVVWVVVVGLAGILRLRRRITIALIVVGVVTVFSFLWHFEFSTDGSLSDPVGIAKFVAVYLGSAVWGAGETAAALVGGIGIALFAVLCVLAWKDRAGRSVALPFGVGVATFVVLTAAQTAAGRLDLGTSQALSSRYSIGSFTFWLGLMVGFLLPLRGRVRSFPLAAPTCLAGAAVAALVVGYRTLPASSFLPTVVFGRELTVVAHRVGINDASSSVHGVQGGPGVAEALSWMARERLGPWAPGGMVDAQRVADTIEPTSRSCLGAIESNEPVGAGRQLRGWIAAPAGEPSSRNLVALDANRRRAGLGLVGAHRPDVRASAAVDSEWTGFVAYVRGESTRPLDVLLLGEDRQTSLCRLESR
jgi:hypothetical protein